MTDYLRRDDIVLGERVDAQLYYELLNQYYDEAALLDEGRYTDWLDYFDEDLWYWAPTRTNRLRREQALAIAKPDGTAFYDETRDSLAWRIRRFDSGMAWSEDPPSRSRHLVTNLTARHGTDAAGNPVVEVRSAILVYRTRLEREENIFVGTRTDVLRRREEGWKIFDRRILLDVNVLPAKNISTFF